MTWDKEEHTRPGLNRPPLSSQNLRAAVEVEPGQDDIPHLVGKLLRATARLETRMRDLQTLPQEVEALRREISEDRGELVTRSSARAAKHTGNRLAVLMGSLFTLYELTAPMVREALRSLHH